MEKKQLTELSYKFYDFVQSYKKLEKKQHNFSNGIKLNLSEMNTIVAIGNQEGINIIKLSQDQEVSRSAVSQMISKLVDKDFVIKSTSKSTRNEVELHLTTKGTEVYLEHKKQHEYLNQEIIKIFEKYPQELFFQLEDIMSDIENIWINMPWIAR
jgi:DNA-binding MarR family transcriptional regulator